MKFHKVLEEAARKTKRMEKKLGRMKKFPQNAPKVVVKKLPGGLRALYVGKKRLGCLYRNRKRVVPCAKSVFYMVSKLRSRV